MTPRENVLLALLIVSVGANVSQLVADRDDDPDPAPPTQTVATTEEQPEPDPPSTVTTPTEPTRAPATTPPEEEEPAASGGTPACSDVEIPPRPPEAITCRTASATLTIVDQARPLLLGDTHVRVQSAHARGRSLSLRVRVRNETDAEQGIQAGGQELYLNLNGIRVDAEPIRDERLPPQTGRTVSVRFVLTPARLRVLERRGGRAELGVRPWTTTDRMTRVGVIRFGVPGG